MLPPPNAAKIEKQVLSSFVTTGLEAVRSRVCFRTSTSIQKQPTSRIPHYTVIVLAAVSLWQSVAWIIRALKMVVWRPKPLPRAWTIANHIVEYLQDSLDQPVGPDIHARYKACDL